jgi:C1A family cysteine protease
MSSGMNGLTVFTDRYGNQFPLGGYRWDREDKDQLRATSIPVRNLNRLLSRAGKTSLPRSFDPRKLFRLDPRNDMKVEDQGNQGSCRGHSGSSGVEFCNWIDTGKMIQLSRAYMYYATQKEDGLLGRDVGSTMNGGVEVLRKYGIPREEHWPYPPTYNHNPPDSWEAQYRKAAEFRIGSHTFLTKAEDTVQFIRSGAGPVDIGISWGGDVEWKTIEGKRLPVFEWRPGQGGHAILLVGWMQVGSHMFVWLLNSWGTRWGDNGWALVHISTLAEMLRHQHTVFVGYSDLENPDRVRDLVDFRKRPALA